MRPQGSADLLTPAGVAQLVEQLIRNQQVTRSSRVAGSNSPSKTSDLRAIPAIKFPLGNTWVTAERATMPHWAEGGPEALNPLAEDVRVKVRTVAIARDEVAVDLCFLKSRGVEQADKLSPSEGMHV